jgi:hypothetical protein
MTPKPEEIEALANAIDRVVFPEPRLDTVTPERQTVALALISHLNESFPHVSVPAARRSRVQRRIIRQLGIPAAVQNPTWLRLEQEMNRRLQGLDPRWTPVVGGAVLVLLGVIGVAYWRQRSSIKPLPALR